MGRVRSEAGFTLPELLVTITISMLILLGAFGLLETVMGETRRTTDRVDATQRGRMAMDVMTRALRSQVCLGATHAVVAGEDSAVTFYTDLGDGSSPPERDNFTFDAARRTLVQTVHAGTGAAPATTFPTQPTRQSTLLTGASLSRNPARQAVPFFRYYAFGTTAPPRPDVRLPTPLSAANRDRVARIEIAYVASAASARAASDTSLTLHDVVYVRAADPNEPAPTPTCT